MKPFKLYCLLVITAAIIGAIGIPGLLWAGFALILVLYFLLWLLLITFVMGMLLL